MKLSSNSEEEEEDTYTGRIIIFSAANRFRVEGHFIIITHEPYFVKIDIQTAIFYTKPWEVGHPPIRLSQIRRISRFYPRPRPKSLI